MHLPALTRLAAACALALPLSSHALNILLTNDDGLTANVRALQSALVAAGHDVVVSVPCQNQSGKGASVNFFAPITPLAKACRNNAAPAGAPGVGPIAGLAQAHYVDGTPVMATLYGLDVLATQRWGKAPDLVISGPNEGQNMGDIVVSSGTVSNAQIALSRGLQAIAISADSDTTGNDALAAEVAQLSVQLISRLEGNTGHKGNQPLVPAGLALNVNVPKFAAGTSASLPWKVTRFGNFNYLDLRFVTDLGANPTAAALGLGQVHLPGVVVNVKTAADAPEGTDPKSESLVNLQGAITLTPMQRGYEASLLPRELYSVRLKKLFERKGKGE